MAGAYCNYCGHRCFVYRQVWRNGEAGGYLQWAGHMATCAEGAAHDREVLGCDATEAYNPRSRSADARQS